MKSRRVRERAKACENKDYAGGHDIVFHIVDTALKSRMPALYRTAPGSRVN